MKRILLIVFVTFVVVTLFVCGKYLLFDIAMEDANYGIRAVSNKEKVSSLFIGSSMFRQGINTAKLDNESFLLAYNGNQPALEFLQIQELLSQGANIKQLVIDMYPYSAASDLNVSDSRIFMDGDIKYTLHVFSLVKHVKGYSYLMSMLLQANNDLFVTWGLTHRLINNRYHRGANTSENVGASKEYLENLDTDFGGGMNHLNETQKRGIKSIINYCKKYNIELVFIETPKYYRIHNNLNYLAMMKEYELLLTSYNVNMILCERTANAMNIKEGGNILTYSFGHEDAFYFIDLIHLSSKGRDHFSSILNSIL